MSSSARRCAGWASRTTSLPSWRSWRRTTALGDRSDDHGHGRLQAVAGRNAHHDTTGGSRERHDLESLPFVVRPRVPAVALVIGPIELIGVFANRLAISGGRGGVDTPTRNGP